MQNVLGRAGLAPTVAVAPGDPDAPADPPPDQGAVDGGERPRQRAAGGCATEVGGGFAAPAVLALAVQARRRRSG